MTLVISIFAAIVVLALLALWVLARRQRREFSWEQLLTELQPLDLAAFRNLLNAEDERFLRAQLPPAAFRRWRKQQLRAAKAYASTLAHNAGILTELSHLAASSTDPEVAAVGANLRETAVSAQLFAFKLRLRLTLGIPSLPGETAGLEEAYRRAVQQIHDVPTHYWQTA